MLTPGTRLGSYEVVSPLGAGGMGEVYRARDPRLDRDVAIKVLPASFSTDAERRARFEREARAVAALSHPNVIAIHDVGSDQDQLFVVMELLEGQTLRERLAGGAEPLRKAIEIAVQIASGLAAAHEKGIVHRDLKPENVFLTRDGRVKILDFGLAAQLAPTAADAATMAGHTQPGVVLGTVGYMAPEQVRGGRVDHRADIFALGAVLFELIAGRRAFERETAAETLTAILKADVPELAAPGRVPLPIDRIVRRCLEKNPDERLQSARDVAIALEAVSGSDASSAVAPVTLPPRRRGLAAGAALLAAGVGLGWLGAEFRRSGGSTALPAFRQLTFRRGVVDAARFAPDGQSLVYSGVWDSGPRRTYPVRLDNPRADAPPLADAALLAVSRSGDLAVATRPLRDGIFITVGTLARVPLGGGAPRELLEGVSAADFAPDGRIAIVRSGAGRAQLEFPPGTRVYETAGWLSSPRFSPDGTRLAFHEHPLHEDDRGWPALLDLASKAKRSLTPEQSSLSGLAWTPDGEEVCFGSVNTIRCARTTRPDMRLVLRQSSRLTLHDIAGDGRMLAVAYRIRGGLSAGDTTGREVDLSWQDLSFPIDFDVEGRLLFGSLDYGVHLRGLDGGAAVRLADGIPAGISPDGQSVLTLTPGVPTTLAIVPVGPGQTRTLPRGPLESHTAAAWLPDGQGVVSSASEPGRGSRLYHQGLDDDPRPFTDEGVRLMPYKPQVVSPDGRFVIAVGPDQQPALYPVAGGDAQPMPALGRDLTPVGWTDHPQVIFARPRTRERLSPVFTVDLSTGRRTLWKEMGPRDPSGAPIVTMIQISRDGRRYAYAVFQTMHDLFLIEGLEGVHGGRP
jgi:hypothetical protein